MEEFDEFRAAAIQMFPECPPDKIEELSRQAAQSMVGIRDLVGKDTLRMLTVIRLLANVADNMVRSRMMERDAS